MNVRPAFCRLLAMFLATSAACSFAWADDAVIVLSGKDGKDRSKKTGTVIDYTGESLQLKSPAGRLETIPAVRIIEIQTEWTAAHKTADALRAAGKLNEAVAALKQAKRDETRVWARRKIMAQLVSGYAEAGRIDFAGDEWLAIVASDPATQDYDVIPLAWRPAAPDAALQSRAAAWLGNTESPPAQLLGASWLLGGERRSDALTTLDRLAADKRVDPRIAALAQVQLWRTKIVTAKLDEVLRWQAAAEKMPAEIQACAHFVVADALARLDQPEAAAMSYLRVPLVHGRQRAMGSDALVEAGKQLEKLGRVSQAAGLYREVTTDYQNSPAADEARSRLGKLAPEQVKSAANPRRVP